MNKVQYWIHLLVPKLSNQIHFVNKKLSITNLLLKYNQKMYWSLKSAKYRLCGYFMHGRYYKELLITQRHNILVYVILQELKVLLLLFSFVYMKSF